MNQEDVYRRCRIQKNNTYEQRILLEGLSHDLANDNFINYYPSSMQRIENIVRVSLKTLPAHYQLFLANEVAIQFRNSVPGIAISIRLDTSTIDTKYDSCTLDARILAEQLGVDFLLKERIYKKFTVKRRRKDNLVPLLSYTPRTD